MILATLATLAAAQGGFSSLPPTHQLFGTEAIAWAATGKYNFPAVWPPVEAPTATHNLVPDELWQERDTWLRLMLKPEWIPADLRERTVAYRQYHGDDILAIRFRKDGWEVQIMELYGQIALSVKGPQALSFPTSNAEVDGFVKQAMRKFLNMTTAELADSKIKGSFETSSADTIYKFRIDSTMGYTFQPSWWMAQGFTDGAAVYFSMVKILDEMQTGGAQQASTVNLGIRFLPGG
jgi:hypothetical protein